MSNEECCGVSTADCESAGADTVEMLGPVALCDETGRYVGAPRRGKRVWIVADNFNATFEFVHEYEVAVHPLVRQSTGEITVVLLSKGHGVDCQVNLRHTAVYNSRESAMRAALVIADHIAALIRKRVERASSRFVKRDEL
jgi:hypothetical protein